MFAAIFILNLLAAFILIVLVGFARKPPRVTRTRTASI